MNPNIYAASFTIMIMAGRKTELHEDRTALEF